MSDEPLTMTHYENIQEWIQTVMTRMTVIEHQMLLIQHLLAKWIDAGNTYNLWVKRHLTTDGNDDEEMMKRLERITP